MYQYNNYIQDKSSRFIQLITDLYKFQIIYNWEFNHKHSRCGHTIMVVS